MNLFKIHSFSIESPSRNREIAENLDLFERMKNGEFEEGKMSLRAKIDMQSGNLNLRDPVIYRIMHANHPRTNNNWCIYPMYDFGHGQYKPITSNRYTSATTESVFHFTKKGDVAINRLAIGQRNQTHPIYPELYSEGRHQAVTRRKIAKKMKFKNYLDVLKNATAAQKKEFNKSVKKLLKENPYDPKKKKCIGNAWFIPYTPTSRLSKQIGVKGDVNSRENSRGQHPATFPPALPEKCIKLSGIKKGSVVYDPFVGTGTTVVEAVKLGMVGIGTDVDDNFVKFSKKRLLQEESLKAKKLIQ